MNRYIDKQSSTTLKGVLMLLIIIGHNHILAPDDSIVKSVLYRFHVICFFILPFLYKQSHELKIRKLVDVVIRNWVPYTFVCLACWLAFSAYTRTFSFGWEHLQAYFTGHQSLLTENFGFVFPWFLPAYCSMSILLMLSRQYAWLFALFSIISVYTFSLSWGEDYYCRSVIPFGLTQAFHYFIYGVLSYFLFQCFNLTKYVYVPFFAVLCICSLYGLESFWTNVSYPIIAFFAILSIAPLLESKLFTLLGKHSLAVYLVHVFICNVLELILPANFFYGMINLALTIVMSILIAEGIQRNEHIVRLLFPRGITDLKNILKSDKNKERYRI